MMHLPRGPSSSNNSRSSSTRSSSRKGSFCKDSAARQRWSKLANTIKKCQKEPEPQQQTFRFPAFEVIGELYESFKRKRAFVK